MNVVHEVQGQEGELHDKVSVIHIGSLSFPSPFMVEVPEVNYISTMQTERRKTVSLPLQVNLA